MAPSVPLPKANTNFCLDLFKKLSDDDKTGNIFFSPFSISTALAMVMLGARGNTHTQMSEVLCFTETEQPKQTDAQSSVMQAQMQTRMQLRTQLQQTSRLPGYLLKCLKSKNDDVHAKFCHLLEKLNKADAPYALCLANRLYGEKSFQFVENFLAETTKHYNSELESVDFAANADTARSDINNWVEKQTQGKIKELLDASVVDNMTRLVLVNAIYFKGNWDKQFKEEKTEDHEFKINKNDSRPVKMMCQQGKFPLTAISDICKILEMPYEGKDLSMLIFLPNETEDDTTGLEKLEKELTYDKFVEWTRPGSEKTLNTLVELKLPRFKMEEKYDLNDVLISMGMKDAFNVTMSDFSGMSPATELFLSKVIHKAFVEVNEEGTEAAAATGAVVDERKAMNPPPFVADHPFLFFIRHNPSMSILFAGRYCSPQ